MSCKLCPYSPSRILCYQQCPKKFEFRYIQRIETDTTYTHLIKGKIIHSLLEHYDLPIKENVKLLMNDNEIKSLLITVDSQLELKTLIRECVKIYENFLKSKMGNEIFEREILVTELSIGLDKQLKPTKFFDDSNNLLFRGKIDMISADRKCQQIFITDWKTGKDRSESYPPDQLLMYGAYYFEKMKDVSEIVLEYVFVEHNTRKTYKIYRDKQTDYKRFLVKSIYDIEQSIEHGKFDTHYTPLCAYCEYSDYCIPI